MSNRRLLTAALLAAVAQGFAGGGVALAAPTDAQKCEAAIEIASGKYALCRLMAESKFTKTGKAVVLSTALVNCSTKLATAYDNALGRWGESCPTVEPVSALDAYIAQCSDIEAVAAGGAFPACGDGAINVAGEQCDDGDLGGETCGSLGFVGGTLGCDAGCGYDTSGCTSGSTGQAFPATGQTTAYGTGSDGDVQAGAALSYTDNGDGTITDNNTGLMWEKKSDDGSIHDKDNQYTWCVDLGFDGCDNGTNAMDGTIVSTFLATLNAGLGFAGHTDWRIPNVKELQSIIDYENVSPSVSPAFNAGCAEECTVLTCSCTFWSLYWSSSTYSVPEYAWYVDFYSGGVGTGGKFGVLYVRAVRGGS